MRLVSLMGVNSGITQDRAVLEAAVKKCRYTGRFSMTRMTVRISTTTARTRF